MRIAFLIFLLLLLPILVSAEANVSIENKAKVCYNESLNSILEMQQSGFNIQRINDSFQELDSLYRSQNILDQKNQSHDFSMIMRYCDEIVQVRDLAFKTKDELEAYNKFYLENSQGINTSSADILVLEAKQEIMNERYEKVSPLIDQAYQDLINEKASSTALNLFYKTTSQTFMTVIYSIRYYLISGIILLIVLFLFFQRQISIFLIKRKLSNLNLRKKTLKNLIMKAQREYFSRGSLSEGNFAIKTKKLSELVRDIDSQIPLLEEQLARLTWRRKGDKYEKRKK